MLRPLPARLRLIRALREAGPATALALLLALILRVPFVDSLAYPDEGGLLLVARRWRDGGPLLYGHFFVDRPPLLLLFWRTADVLGGVEAARWLGCVLVGILIVAAGWSGWLLAERRGARLAALTAAALASTPILGTHEVDAELLGVPLILLCCTFALMTLRRCGVGAQARWAMFAGLAGSGAVLVKQNLVDGLVFGVALGLVAGLTGVWTRSRTVRFLGFGALGAGIPLSATVLWAATRGQGVAVLWATVVGFRADASAVITEHDMGAPELRLFLLGLVLVVSGMGGLVMMHVWSLRHGTRGREPFTIALTAMLLVELLGVLMGASYWTHYLIALIPGATLAVAGLAGRRIEGHRRLVPLVSFVVLSSVVATLVSLMPLAQTQRDGETHLVQWLDVAGRPGDTALVLYGHPNIIEASGMQPAYPYLWSLPLRTLDPQLDRLVATLNGGNAPTWIVEWLPSDSWDIDVDGRLSSSITAHYRAAGTICGVPIYLNRATPRALPSRPADC